MNCLHISFNEYPSIVVEHATKQIWRELMRDFDEYHVLGRSTDHRFHSEREGKLWLHRMPKGSGNKIFSLQQFLLPYYIKRYHIGVMVTQCCLLGGVAGVVCSKLYRIPILVEIHGNHYFDIMDSGKIYDRILAIVIRWVYNHATLVRALNPMMKAMLEEHDIHSKIVIVQNRVNLKLFQPCKSDYSAIGGYRLVAVGSFVSLKGHCLLIDLVKRIGGEYPGLKLTLIGGGPLLEDYRCAAEGSSCFEFIEDVPQSEIVKLLREADIFLHPSFSEAVPRAIIEAMAMGLPIIASDAGMISGLIKDGENGVLFHVGDVEALEVKVRNLLNDEELRRRLGMNAYRDAVDNYDWNKNFEKYREMLRDLFCD